ncbi:MAG: hypothetical protein WD669_11765 [Pirellulales bacterium]
MATICRVMLIGLLVSFAAPSPAGAQSGVQVQNNGVITVPGLFKFSRKSGLALTIDPRWASNYGYHPVEVTVRAARPSASDRVVTILLHSSSWNSRWGSITVKQQIELPQGSTSATTTVVVPQYQQYQWVGGGFCWFDVWVDGVKDNDLSIDFGAINTTSQQASNMSFLAVGLNAPSRQLVALQTPDYGLLPLAIGDLPSRWIEYTAFDVVTLSLADLKNTAASNPQALQAIRRWLHAGGQMWIHDAGQEWEQLAEIERLLNLPTPPRDATNEAGQGMTDSEARDRGWRPVRPWPDNWDGRTVTFTDRRNGLQTTLRDSAKITQYSANRNYYISENKQTAIAKADASQPGQPAGRATSDSTRWFLDHSLGFGNVRAFRGNEVLSAFKQWQQAVAPVVATTAPTVPSTGVTVTAPPAVPDPPLPMAMALEATPNWVKRHGLSPETPNAEFAEWLVPGVGLAPVTEFRILITLFVLLIGPVNYLLLKRYRQLHLLVLTVPLAAALLTIALFVYALASDGLNTKVRVRSFTTLDQRSGEAACWARLSYYAGLAPGSGLSMPSDTAVYPIVPDWRSGGGNSEYGVARELTWNGDNVHLARGWLRSRTSTQYLTVRARNSPQRLQLRPGDGRMRAENELNASIRFVTVADAAGNLFAGTDLASGDSADLLPIESAAAARRFAEFARDNLPQSPPELDAAMPSPMTGSMFVGQMYAYGYSNYPGDLKLSENLMQTMLDRAMGGDAAAELEIPRRSYVAITQTGPEVELGVAGAREEASFHVIAGQW